MLIHTIEWQPASLCSIDSFDGSVSSGGGPVENSTGSNNGNSNGVGDISSGGYATTGADVAALGVIGGAGAIGGAAGALAGTFGLAVLGLNPQQAAVDVAHDMSLGLGHAVTANPTISMYESGALTGSVFDSFNGGNAGNVAYLPIYPSGGGTLDGG